MFTFSIHLASNVYLGAHLERAFPHFFGIAYPLLLLYGPLVYLYAVCASDRTRGLRWTDTLHFVPFVAVVIAGLPIYLMSGDEKLAFYQQLLQGERPLLLRIVDPLKYVSGIAYAAATILVVQRHRTLVKENYSSIERVNLQWLLTLAGAAAAIWGLAALLSVMHRVDLPILARDDDIVALAIAVLVYGIGYMAIRQPEVIRFATSEFRIPRSGSPTGANAVPPPPPPAPSTAPAPTDPAGPRYERSGLSEAEADKLQQELLSVMETERAYQDGELTLADLADRLETTPHKLSELLNSQLEQSFYDFVNAYRVREVQRRITDEKYRNLTVLALAMDAGFASKSTFNHVFKKHTGQTPSAYRRAVVG